MWLPQETMRWLGLLLLIGWASAALIVDEEGDEGLFTPPANMTDEEYKATFGLGYEYYATLLNISIKVKTALRKKIDQPDNPDDNNPFFFGDMLLMPGQIYDILNHNYPDLAEEIFSDYGYLEERSLEKRKIIIFEKYMKYGAVKWPTTIYWLADDTFSSSQLTRIKAAMAEVGRETCIRYLPSTPDWWFIKKARIRFVDYDGKKCASYEGRVMSTEQPITAGRYCFLGFTLPGDKKVVGYHGRVLHEILHSLGAIHEHQRKDRDKFVTFPRANSSNSGDIHNILSIRNQQDAILAAVPYDMSSLMHYHDAKVEELPTVDLDLRTSYQEFGMTFYDSKAINMAYCSKVCSKKLPCQRGGYTDPKDCSKCRCPDGWTGELCNLYFFEKPFNAYKCPNTGLNALFLEEKCIEVDFRHTETINTNCHWYILTTNGPKIHYWFESMDILRYGGCYDSVEVRHRDGLETRGRRFCGHTYHIPSEYRAPNDVKVTAAREMLVSLRSFLVKDPSYNQYVAFKLCLRDTQCRVRHDGDVFAQSDTITKPVHNIPTGDPGHKEVLGWLGGPNDRCRVNVTVTRMAEDGTQWASLQVGRGTKKNPDTYYRAFAFNHWGRGGVWERGTGIKPTEITTFPFSWRSVDSDDIPEMIVVIYKRDQGYWASVLCVGVGGNQNFYPLYMAFDMTPETEVGLYTKNSLYHGYNWEGVCRPR